MGSICPSGMSNAVTVEVDADSDTVWSIITNMEVSAMALASTKSFEYVRYGDENDPCSIGTEARVVARMSGLDVTVRNQIISININNNDDDNDNDDSNDDNTSYNNNDEADKDQQQQRHHHHHHHHVGRRSISFHTIYEEGPKGLMDFSNTTTLTIVPLSDTVCELIGTTAFQSTGTCFWRIMFCSWTYCYNTGKIQFQRDLNQLAIVAEENYVVAAAKKKEKEKERILQ